MPDDHSDLTHHGVDDPTKTTYPNEIIRLLIDRSSCRSFSDKKIPDDVLASILDAGIHAASGGNLQPFSIIKITDDTVKAELAHLNENQLFIKTAPVNLLFCIDWRRIMRWAALEHAPCSAQNSFRHFWISFQDTIIAAQNICTAADALGLGSVYVGTVLECFRETRTLLKIPAGVFPVVLLSLGYPKFRPAPKKKLSRETIVHNEFYRDLPDAELLAAFESKYPDWKMETTSAKLDRIAKVCRAVHGSAFAEACIAAIQEQGYINAAQNYFGLHYCADEMPMRNDEFLAIIKEFGFGWFEKFKPVE
jgi:FMN reductase [NAD(P)H]